MALLARDISEIIFGGSTCALFSAGSSLHPSYFLQTAEANPRFCLLLIGMAASALHPMLNVGV